MVWLDYRSASDSDIYGTRVTAAGAVTDGASTGLALCTEASNQQTPAVASNGTDYLVVWDDGRNGSDIYGTRVTAAGAVTDGAATGLALSTAAGGQGVPAVASNGTDYLVVWQDTRGGGASSDIYGTRVTAADGGVTDGVATGLALSTATDRQQYPAVASNGTDYLVAWFDRRSGSYDIYGTRVTAAGAVTDGAATGLALSTATNSQYFPAVASNGPDYLVAWQDYRNGPYDIYGTRVSAAGVVTDGAATGFAILGGLARPVRAEARRASRPSVPGGLCLGASYRGAADHCRLWRRRRRRRRGLRRWRPGPRGRLLRHLHARDRLHLRRFTVGVQ